MTATPRPARTVVLTTRLADGRLLLRVVPAWFVRLFGWLLS
jgi:hypothetical protein